MTLNEYCLKVYGKHWILLLAYQQTQAIENYQSFSGLFNALFNEFPFKG